MAYKTKNIFKEETLPWETYIPKNADKIILGTYPTIINNRDFDFFYPNKNNKFWNVLAKIANLKLADFNHDKAGKELAVKERKQVLDKLKLALSDMGYKVLRQNNSSLDSNLFPVEFIDIFQIIKDNPKIKTIILTSSSKGNSALSWFKTYCIINGIDLPSKKKKNKLPMEFEIFVENKRLKVAIVYSTSGLAAKPVEFLVEQYSKIINS